jgi:hypothetical protein
MLKRFGIANTMSVMRWGRCGYPLFASWGLVMRPSAPNLNRLFLIFRTLILDSRVDGAPRLFWILSTLTEMG